MAVRGSASIDTGKFTDKQKLFISKMKFSKLFDERVNMKNVRLSVIRPWITEEINRILGFDDDIVSNLIFNLLEKSQFPDPKDLTISLTGFLDADAYVCSQIQKKKKKAKKMSKRKAQDDGTGIPRSLLSQAQQMVKQQRDEAMWLKDTNKMEKGRERKKANK
ncbi:hypothetical protein RFI_18867 [Reticulomyxa filosa]|uniref:PWI domain-containing protein n=1 Tax=Reticulomyxa filosa TaxID=46433 RepID=X6MWN3_RETFI|nr:hypothetical protein RFI_18867 [Reticulomyxa filosa]|eukprot:ETO18398.1 hypothetical protein RFI_18867 [Reticulomyxa filosa]